MDTKGHVLQSDESRFEVARLSSSPIIQQMEKEIPEGFDMSSAAFAVRALQEYNRRGGSAVARIGAVADAIRNLRKQRIIRRTHG